MFRIIQKRWLTPETAMIRIEAPWVARKARPGQFVIVRLKDGSERIPLSLSGWDRVKGTLRLIIQGVGFSSKQLIGLEVGDSVLDLVGPLGSPTHLPDDGTLVVIGGGYGTGAILPAAREAKSAGRHVIGIIGARSRDLVLLEDEMREVCNEVFVTTNDGSQGIKGFVTHALEPLFDRYDIGAVLAIGPVPMMRAVSDMTKPKGVPTIVSLNAVMVDGTGMCGGCRVTVGGETKFACFDGPDFDGHTVDYDELMLRQTTYREYERRAMDHLCHITEQESIIAGELQKAGA